MQNPSSDIGEMTYRAANRSGSAVQTDRARTRMHGGDPQSITPGYVVRPNKKAVRRKRSTFNIVLVLFGCGIGIVLYISNILTVNRLAFEMGQLQTRYDKLVSDNQALRAEIDRKSGRDRISKIAVEQIGLRYPMEQPNLFDIDPDKLDDPARPVHRNNQP